MSNQIRIDGIVAWVAITLIAVSGCETLSKAGVPGLEQYIVEDPEILAAEKKNRQAFMDHHDHKALYWLLSHRVHNGMQLHEIEEILGTPGESTTELQKMKSDGVHQANEPAFKWGPDNKGYSVILFFRENAVCNFSPKDYLIKDFGDAEKDTL